MSERDITPGDLIGYAMTQPWATLTIGAVVALVAFAFSMPRAARPASAYDDAANPRYAPERRTIGATAVAVVVLFLADHFVRGYALNMNGAIAWWRYAAPLFVAFLGTAALLAFICTTGSGAPQHPVVGAARRTWLTFAPRARAVAAGVVVLLLAATAVLAGLLSSVDVYGNYTYLEIPIPNAPSVDPIRHWFFGWAYGGPVLVALVALVAMAVACLHANAARPFMRPETVVAEQNARRGIASGIVHVATASALLSLAGAWRLIADAGATTRLSIEGDGRLEVYEILWRGSEIATVLGWLAPAAEVVAFALLLLATRHLRNARIADTAPDAAVAVAS